MSFAKKKTPTESKYWHFRVNDLSNEQYEKLKSVECEWIVIGNHERENEKGEHYHVAVKFERSVRRNFALTNLLFNESLSKDKDYYLESKYTKTSVEQFISYVSKSGIRHDTYHAEEEEDAEKEEETKPEKPKLSPGELNKLRLQKAREGDEEWFLVNDFKFMLSNQYPKLLMLAQPHNDTILEGELCNYWVFGPSGTGKSSSIHLLWPNAYSKVVSNSKWDNYSNTNPGHEVVHIEEVDEFADIEEGLEGLAGLKRMADRYPFPVRFNYGSRNLMIRPKTFVITSNFSPQQILASGDKYGRPTRGLETQLKAIARKFKVMHIEQFKKEFGIVDKLDTNGKLIGCRFIDDTHPVSNDRDPVLHVEEPVKNIKKVKKPMKIKKRITV